MQLASTSLLSTLNLKMVSASINIPLRHSNPPTSEHQPDRALFWFTNTPNLIKNKTNSPLAANRFNVPVSGVIFLRTRITEESPPPALGLANRWHWDEKSANHVKIFTCAWTATSRRKLSEYRRENNSAVGGQWDSMEGQEDAHARNFFFHLF